MDPIVQAQIEELRKKYPDDESASMMSEWERTLKKSDLFLDLKNHAAFQIIVDNYYQELKKINKTLQDDVSLFKDPESLLIGRMLHERKRFIQTFLRPFELARVDSESTKKIINIKLEQSNDQPQY